MTAQVKKKLALLLPALALILAVVLVSADYHAYQPRSRTAPDSPGGLVFTITAYDGESEDELFVNCMGHAWLALDNQTDHSVTLGEREIRPGEILTFSTWALSGHFGVVYNLEPRLIAEEGRYAGRTSLSVEIAEEQLPTLADAIRRHSAWSPLKNCSVWAVRLWNELVGGEYDLPVQTLVYTPGRLQKALWEFSVTETDRDFSRAGEIFILRDGVPTELRYCP